MNRVFINIGSIKIYWYSITMLLAILVGTYLSIRESKNHKMESFINDLIFKMIISGIIGARIYYVIFNFQLYKNDILSVFKIWEGGLAIYGAIIGGLIIIIYNCIKERKKILEVTDIFIPGLIIAQSIGRWGNFFNGEAHGPVTTLEYLQKINIPKFIINGMNINGIYYEPTFLYESLWCLIGFLILIIIRKKMSSKYGNITFIYFIWYGIGRFFIEGIRTDSLYLGNIRISQLVSILIIIIGTFGLIYNKQVRREKNEKKLL